MKNILLSAFVALAFVLGACEQQSNITAPADAQAPVTADEQLLSLDGFDNSMFADDPGDRKIDPRLSVGSEAAMWVRLLLAANPDMDDATKAALKAALGESNKRIMEILRDQTMTAEQKRAAIAQEQKDLMDKINGNGETAGIVSPEQIAKANELKAKLEQERKERQEKLIEARINNQIKIWTAAMRLTPEQQAAIKIALLQKEKDMAQARIDFAKDPAGLSKKLREIQAASDAAIRAMLTPEQQLIWDKLHGKVSTGGSTIEQRVDQQVKYWTPILKLDAEQQALLRTELIKKEKAIAQARIDFAKDPAGLSKKLKEIETESNAAIRAMLNAEQQAIWDKMHGNVKTDTSIEARVEQQLKSWITMLKLTDGQVSEIRPLLLQREKDMAQARIDFAKDPAGLAKKLQEIQTASNAAIRSLLTEEQQIIWDRMYPTKGGVIGTRG